MVATTRAQATGPADPDRVWRRYLFPVRWSGWAPYIRRVEWDTAPEQPTPDPAASPTTRLTRGMRGRVVGPLGIRVRVEIGEVEPDTRRWTWRVHVAGAVITMVHGIDPAGSGSRAWVQMTGPAVAVRPYRLVATWPLRRLVR